MGHERLGTLPRSQKWYDLVSDLESFSIDSNVAISVIQRTIHNVRSRLGTLTGDASVVSAVEFLVALCVSFQNNKLAEEMKSKTSLNANMSPTEACVAARTWINMSPGRPEYSSLANSAIATAISKWFILNNPGQGNLFDFFGESENVWMKARTGGGFSELARLFYSGLIERYTNYFIDREAASAVENIEALHVLKQRISIHAFETAKIIQSFSAGWFNGRAQGQMPSREDVKAFVSYCTGKFREELLREEEK